VRCPARNAAKRPVSATHVSCSVRLRARLLAHMGPVQVEELAAIRHVNRFARISARLCVRPHARLHVSMLVRIRVKRVTAKQGAVNVAMTKLLVNISFVLGLIYLYGL
jgi:hypothetical protein